MKACYVVLALVAVAAADLYDSKYDSFDVQELIANDKILINYIKCFLGEGPCTADAKNFKKVMPEAIETTCSRCSPKQQQLIRQVIKVIIEKHPKYWEQLIDKYDPQRKHKESFEKFLREE